MIVFAALVVLVVAFWYGLKLAAGIGTKKALAHRNFLRDATPPHYQGRDADLDEWKRPW